MMPGFTNEQAAQYRQDGWVVMPSLFTGAECDALIEHMAAVHSGDIRVEGFSPPADGESHLVGTDQTHLHDPVCRNFMLNAKLRAPLRDALGGDEPEGIKSHYWWKGSEWSQAWHCDGTALPGCIGAWIPLVDVDETVGTLGLQSGGHRRRKIHHDDLREGKWAGNRTHSGDGELRKRLADEIFAENVAAGLEDVRIVAKRGAAVIFDGHIWHRGVMGEDPDVFRQVFASHYIPAGFAEWPHVLWERLSFDGVARLSTGDEPTEAARHNARLPAHPAMPLLRGNKHPSLMPTRKDAPLRILSERQAHDMDALGYCVLDGAVDARQLAALRAEIDQLELESNPPGSTGDSGRVRAISVADQISFTSGLAQRSRLAREFCGSALLSDICHDVLNAPDVRLYHDQAVYKKPCPGRVFPFHQDNGCA